MTKLAMKRHVRPLTRREAYALCLLAFLASLFLADAIGASGDAVREQTARLRSERVAGEDGAGQDVWQRRSEASRSSLDAWRTQVWHAETTGLVAARADEALTGLIGSAGGTGSVNVETALASSADRQALRFELAMRADDVDGAWRVLSELAAHEPRLIAEEVRINIPPRGGSQLEVDGLVPFQLVGVPGPGGS